MLRLRLSLLAGIAALVALSSVLPSPGPVPLSPRACITDWGCERRFGPVEVVGNPFAEPDSELPLASAE